MYSPLSGKALQGRQTQRLSLAQNLRTNTAAGRDKENLEDRVGGRTTQPGRRGAEVKVRGDRSKGGEGCWEEGGGGDRGSNEEGRGV